MSPCCHGSVQERALTAVERTCLGSPPPCCPPPNRSESAVLTTTSSDRVAPACRRWPESATSGRCWLLDPRGEGPRRGLPADGGDAGADHLGDAQPDARCDRPSQGPR